MFRRTDPDGGSCSRQPFIDAISDSSTTQVFTYLGGYLVFGPEELQHTALPYFGLSTLLIPAYLISERQT